MKLKNAKTKVSLILVSVMLALAICLTGCGNERMDNAEADIAAINQKIAQITADVAEVTQNMNDGLALKATIQELEAVKTLVENNGTADAALAARVDGIVSDLEDYATSEEVAAAIAALKVGDINAAITALTSRVAALEEKLKDINFATILADIAALKAADTAAAGAVDQKVAALTALIEANQKAIEDLQETVSDKLGLDFAQNYKDATAMLAGDSSAAENYTADEWTKLLNDIYANAVIDAADKEYINSCAPFSKDAWDAIVGSIVPANYDSVTIENFQDAAYRWSFFLNRASSVNEIKEMFDNLRGTVAKLPSLEERFYAIMDAIEFISVDTLIATTDEGKNWESATEIYEAINDAIANGGFMAKDEAKLEEAMDKYDLYANAYAYLAGLKELANDTIVDPYNALHPANTYLKYEDEDVDGAYTALVNALADLNENYLTVDGFVQMLVDESVAGGYTPTPEEIAEVKAQVAVFFAVFEEGTCVENLIPETAAALDADMDRIAELNAAKAALQGLNATIVIKNYNDTNKPVFHAAKHLDTDACDWCKILADYASIQAWIADAELAEEAENIDYLYNTYVDTDQTYAEATALNAFVTAINAIYTDKNVDKLAEDIKAAIDAPVLYANKVALVALDTALADLADTIVANTSVYNDAAVNYANMKSYAGIDEPLFDTTVMDRLAELDDLAALLATELTKLQNPKYNSMDTLEFQDHTALKAIRDTLDGYYDAYDVAKYDVNAETQGENADMSKAVEEQWNAIGALYHEKTEDLRAIYDEVMAILNGEAYDEKYPIPFITEIKEVSARLAQMIIDYGIADESVPLDLPGFEGASGEGVNFSALLNNLNAKYLSVADKAALASAAYKAQFTATVKDFLEDLDLDALKLDDKAAVESAYDKLAAWVTEYLGEYTTDAEMKALVAAVQDLSSVVGVKYEFYTVAEVDLIVAANDAMDEYVAGATEVWDDLKADLEAIIAEMEAGTQTIHDKKFFEDTAAALDAFLNTYYVDGTASTVYAMSDEDTVRADFALAMYDWNNFYAPVEAAAISINGKIDTLLAMLNAYGIVDFDAVAAQDIATLYDEIMADIALFNDTYDKGCACNELFPEYLDAYKAGAMAYIARDMAQAYGAALAAGYTDKDYGYEAIASRYEFYATWIRDNLVNTHGVDSYKSVATSYVKTCETKLAEFVAANP